MSPTVQTITNPKNLSRRTEQSTAMKNLIKATRKIVDTIITVTFVVAMAGWIACLGVGIITCMFNN